MRNVSGAAKVLALATVCFSLGSTMAGEKGLKPPKCAYVEARASFYAGNFIGRRTANGEIFTSREMTAAHKSLPFGTKLKVTNPANGKSVHVVINDRGPYIKGRTLDLSLAAAEQLDMVEKGVARVEIESCSAPKPASPIIRGIASIF